MEVVFLLSAERISKRPTTGLKSTVEGEQFFLQDVQLRLEHLQKFPLIGRLYRGRYRRLLIPRYPFGIFYVVESNRIVVHAVPDLRQDPEKIRERFFE
jgi:plasmid stabilization system protein ParE